MSATSLSSPSTSSWPFSLAQIATSCTSWVVTVTVVVALSLSSLGSITTSNMSNIYHYSGAAAGEEGTRKGGYGVNAFIVPVGIVPGTTQLSASLVPDFITNIFASDDDDNNNDKNKPRNKKGGQRLCRARDLMLSLVDEQQCFTTEIGADNFLECCSDDIVFEDCYEQKEPIVGIEMVSNCIRKKVAAKTKNGSSSGTIRIDRISDGDTSCGYAWTWISKDGAKEGLRGTTFIELGDDAKIVYMREIPEPIYKPGDATLTLLKAVTKNAVPKPKPQYTIRTPTIANEIARYLFLDVQGSEIDESMKFFDDTIQYRDFNYDEMLVGRDEVRQFIVDFSFPGIEFRTEKFDDGIQSTCFTWKVLLDGVDEQNAVKGISFYELDPTTKKVNYVRDVPESSIKPAPIGKLARLLNPELGIFGSFPTGSRPGGK